MEKNLSGTRVILQADLTLAGVVVPFARAKRARAYSARVLTVSNCTPAAHALIILR